MNLQGKKVLVAGGTGLVGANLALRLKDLGANVRATYFSRKPSFLPENFKKFDFTELDQCLEATKDMQYVFICAAQTFGAKIMKENPTALVLPNLRINSGLLEACRLNKVEKVVFISSSTVYQEAFFPIREDELDLNIPTYDLYLGVGGMKRYIEQLCRFYFKTYGMKIGIVRPTNIYGPYDKFDDDKSHVLPALIKRALKKENPYVVWGDGYTVRDFIYVDDFVDALMNVLQRYCVCDPINFSSGTSITIREAVGVILEACGHPVGPRYDERKPIAIPYRMLNTTKYNSIFGAKKQTSFAEGIQKTVAWYRSTL
ncbi:MAG: NAD-dependent epimerase/dehydratase family protein [Deltaproteobacteria bacterium]|nr:NAD-dependent epimerase/dehydratase family protein [Deltaproteobacteria bacterium]